jgi:HAMP domain-containing protein
MPTGIEHDDTGPLQPSAPTLLWKALTRRGLGGDDSVPRMRLATRLALSIALLLGAFLGAALAFATWRANAVAARDIEQKLQAVPAIYAGFESAAAGARRQQVRSLADQPGTKALLGERGIGPETFRDSALDFAQSLGARVVVFVDARGALIARGDRPAGEEAGRDFSGVTWVREPLVSGTDTWAYILDVKTTRTLLLVAAAPVTQGEGRDRHLIGVVAAAFALDDAQAEELGRLMSGEAAFLGNLAPRGAAPDAAVVAATPRLRHVPFQERLSVLGALDPLFRAGQPRSVLELAAEGDDYIGTVLPIRSGSGEAIAALVVARSKAAELAAFHEIRRAIVAIGVFALVLSVPLSLALARHVSRPIERLAEAAHAIRAGQIDTAVPKLPEAGSDEVGVLARAFAAMVAELREKAALEQWVPAT